MSVAEALRMMNAGLDYLNGPGAHELDAASCGPVLRSLGEIEAKFTAAHAAVLGRFDAADAHDSDGYGNSVAWLMAMTSMTRPDARAEVRQMRLLRDHHTLTAALAAKDISKSQALAIAEWTKKLPAELRAATIKILTDAAAAGATLDDLYTIAGVALDKWRSSRPDGDDDGFDDRYVQVGTTLGGAGVIRGNLTPECAAAVQAVLEALGKKADAEDVRTEGQRFHDALQQGCQLLIRAKMVPDRAGADTHVAVHIPFPELRQHPEAPEQEEAWLRGKAGEPGYLTGKDAEAAACDALNVPVVTAHADMRVVDRIIAFALAAAGITLDGADPDPADDASNPDRSDPDDSDPDDAGPEDDAGDGYRPWGTTSCSSGAHADRAASRARIRARERFTPGAMQALPDAIARLAIDFVSGPCGIASWLRTTLLAPPYSTPSVPLDIGYSDTIPASIRRAVLLRDRGCAWPRCGRPAAWCDVHHLTPTGPPPPTDPPGRSCTATHRQPPAPGETRPVPWNQPPHRPRRTIMPEVTLTTFDSPALGGEDALEPFCTTCGGRAGIFTSRRGAWLHYIGALDDYDVEPYDPGHAPVVGWRPTPGIVFVAR